MYYPKSKIIFIAINKTGSSSALTALNQALYDPDVPDIWKKQAFTHRNRLRNYENLKHAHADFYRHYLGEEEFSKCYVFSLVRNPFDQIVSSFIFRCRAPKKIELWKKQRKWFLDNGLLEPTASPEKGLFKLFVKAIEKGDQGTHPAWKTISEKFDMADSGKSFLNQIDGLTNLQGKIIVDDIFRFEALSEGWGDLQRTVRAKAAKTLGDFPHINSSVRNDYRHYYDDDTFDIVSALCRKDIDYFGYSF